MPHISVTMYPGRDDETKKALAQKLQDFVAEELCVKKDIVSVSVTDIPPKNWEAEMRKLPPGSVFVNHEPINK